MDFDANLTVDHIVKEGTKGNRIEIWGKIFQKYERLSNETTEDIEAADIEKTFLRSTKDFNIPFMQKIVKRKRGRPKSNNCLSNETTEDIEVVDIEKNVLRSTKDFNIPFMQVIVKRKRGRPKSNKVKRKIKRSKVLKVDDQVKCVSVGEGVSDAGANVENCISEEDICDVTYINTIEELKKHPRLVKSLVNQKLFKTSSESDCSDEVLRVDDCPEDDLIGKSNLIGEQSNLSQVLSQNIQEIQTDVKTSYEIEKLHDKDGNSTKLMNTDDQICTSRKLVEEWLNKSEPFRQCIPSRCGSMVYSPKPVVPSLVKSSQHNNIVVLEKEKTNHCNGKSKGQDYVKGIELCSKRISPRIKKSKFCRSCSNHNSPKKADICFTKQEDVETDLSNQNQEDCSSERCKGENLDGFTLENRLGKEMLARSKQPKICKSSKEIENCCTQKENVEKLKMNVTYDVLKNNKVSPNMNHSNEQTQLNSKIKLEDLQVTESDYKNVQRFKIENLSMEEMFYKRRKRAKVCESSRKVHISPTKQSSMINWLNTLKSESISECSTIFQNENIHRKDDPELIKHNHRILKTSNSNSRGQLDESSRINSLACLSKSSNTSTPIKDMLKLPPTHNKDDLNYLKIKNKIENEFKSKLSYMVYKRHELRQNYDDSNKEETEFWESSVKSEIQKLSHVIPSTALIRYMKESVNSRINLSG